MEPPQNSGDYDMTTAGFDGFMSRSIDQTPQINLDSATPPNNAIAFDRNQVTGALGDTFRLGKIYLNGSTGTIIMSDGTNDVLLIGDDS